MARDHSPRPSGQCRWLALLLGVLALWNLRTFTATQALLGRSLPDSLLARLLSLGGGGGGDAWASHLDPASGRVFYVHAATGEARWTRPDVVDGWTTHRDAATGRSFRFRAETGESEWLAAAAESGAAAGAAGAGADGWAAHVDAETGRTYHYHAASGESRWDEPDAAGSPAAFASPASGRTAEV